MVFRKPNFGQPPEGYIAGLGRGAVGFITRGDVGTARVGEQTFSGHQISAPLGGTGKRAPGQPSEQIIQTSDANYDEWSGYGGSLFAGLKEDNEDKEADAAYAEVDRYLEGRRQKKREEKIKELNKAYAQDQVNIKAKFVDVKKRLADVTREDWEALPDAQDLVKQNKKRKLNEKQRFTPVPDSVIQGNPELGSFVNQIDPNQDMNQSHNGNFDGTQSTIADVGEARQKLFQIELNRAQDQVGTTTSQASFNKEGYMTDLNSLKINSETQLNDLKKARVLLKAVIKANPMSSSGWVAAARVEELDGKLNEARSILEQACLQFPHNEDVWVEAARMQEPSKVKAFIAKAVSNMPQSKKLWLMGALSEKDNQLRSKVLRRALEHIPTEVAIWKELIQLEDTDEAKLLLRKAVGCIPSSTDLWLALAKLETYQEARKVLNNASSANPHSTEIYIAAAKLEEAQDNIPKIPQIVRKMVKNLTLSRETYLQEAVKCDISGSILTCECIIESSITLGMDAEDKKSQKQSWLANVDVCIQQSAIFSARYILKHALKLVDAKSLWMKAYQVEKQFGTLSSQLKLFEKAHSSKHEFLKLLHAKILWKQGGSPDKALEILQKCEKSDDICLAISKIHRYLKQYDLAQKSLQIETDDERVLMQRVQVLREMGQQQAALAQCEEAIQIRLKSPYWKLYLIKAQIIESLLVDQEQVRTAYENGILACGKSCSIVWTQAAAYETKLEQLTRARTILQKARIKLPNDPLIWLYSVRLELQSSNEKIAQHLLARALQQCPESGQLWALAIEMEPHATRMRKSTDAVQHNKANPCTNPSYIFLAIGKYFWAENKIAKARKFMQQAVELDKDFADAWLYLHAIEQENDKKACDKVRVEFVEAEPHHGEIWQSTSKKIENWNRSPLEIMDQIRICSPKLF